MQNSCAYDASFVILYSLYSRNITRWTEQLEAFQNSALNNISEGFQKIQRGQKTFEQVRDHIRCALELEDYNNFHFGRYTSLITLWEHILQAPHAIRKSYYQCQNGHRDHVQYGNSGAYTLLWWEYFEGESKYESGCLNFDQAKYSVKRSREFPYKEIHVTFCPLLLPESKFKQLA